MKTLEEYKQELEQLHEEQRKTLEAKELALEKLHKDFGEQIVKCKDKYNRLKSELERELNDIHSRKKVAIRGRRLIIRFSLKMYIREKPWQRASGCLKRNDYFTGVWPP